MLDGDSNEARALLEQALSIDPGHAEARRLLNGLTAHQAEAQGQPWLAIVEQIHHMDLADLVGEAQRALHAGDYDLALALSRRALAIDPDSAEAREMHTTAHTLKTDVDLPVSYEE